MAAERVPGEKMYIDWVGDQPELLLIPDAGEVKRVHIFATTLGVSSLIYAEVFLDEKLSSFVEYQAPRYISFRNEVLSHCSVVR